MTGMEPLGLNYRGEPVGRDSSGFRFALGAVESKNDDTAARVLSFSEKEEDFWLCALAYVAHDALATHPAKFFAICSEPLQGKSDKRLLAKRFAVNAIAAINLMRNHEGPSVGETFGGAKKEHFLKLLELSGHPGPWCDPKAVLMARRFAEQAQLSGVSIPFQCVDPFEGSDIRRCFSCSSDDLAWRLRDESGLFRGSAFVISESDADSFLSTVDGIPALLSKGGGDVETVVINGKPSFVVSKGIVAKTTGQDAQLTAETAIREPSDLAATGSLRRYEPISTAKGCSSVISEDMLQSFDLIKTAVAKEIPKWDEYVSSALGISIADMAERLAPEQIDACGLAIRAMGQGKAFILGDETGTGKGRILAAIAVAFARSNRKIVFVTERRMLFSDFWRDVSAVAPDFPLESVMLFHPKGAIFSESGAPLLKASKKASELFVLEPSKENGPVLTMTTYSQFNRKGAAGAKKTAVLECFLNGKGLVILDESHNCSGDSTTAKTFAKIIKGAGQCLFSSATFAKTEKALLAYGRALPFAKREMEILLAGAERDPGLSMARAISKGLAAYGTYIRRGHAPDKDEAPFETFVCDTKRSVDDDFSGALAAIFNVHSIIVKTAAKREANKSWMKIGGFLARACRQFSVVSKIPHAVSKACESVAAGRKPVIFLESTFESFLTSICANKISFDASDEDGTGEDDKRSDRVDDPSIRRILLMAMEQMIADSGMDGLAMHPDVIEARAAIAKLPFLMASPIDDLIRGLEGAGVSIGEVSGRSTRLRQSDDGWVVEGFDLPAREKTISEFNSGAIQAIIVTVAGATGISLHSSRSFGDPSPRDFLELEIISNPLKRKQAFGRVKRKGQAHPPRYVSLVTKSPFERRAAERAAGKAKKISSLSSCHQEAEAASSSGSEFLSAHGNRAALEWLAANHHKAAMLGMDVWDMNPEEREGEPPAERLLKRLPLLSTAEQDEVFDLLEAASFVESDFLTIEEAGFFIANGSIPARRCKIWGGTSTVNDPSTVFDRSVFATEWVIPSSSSSSFDKGEISSMVAMAKKAPPAAIAFPQKTSNSDHRVWRHMQSDMAGTIENWTPGKFVSFSNPANGMIRVGVALELIRPASDALCKYPSAWGGRIVFLNERTVATISIGRFISDGNAGIYDSETAKKTLARTGAAKPTRHFSSVSGHCVFSKWWANKMGSGRDVSFADHSGHPREETVVHGATGGIGSFKSLPMPLPDFTMAIRLLQRDPAIALVSGNPESPDMILRSGSGGWSISFDQRFHDLFVDYPLSRRLGPPKRETVAQGSPPRIFRNFISRDAFAILANMQSKGAVFMVPASKRKWFSSEFDDWERQISK